MEVAAFVFGFFVGGLLIFSLFLGWSSPRQVNFRIQQEAAGRGCGKFVIDEKTGDAAFMWKDEGASK